MDKDDTDDRWRRMALRSFMIISAARWQAALLEIHELPSRRMDPFWEDVQGGDGAPTVVLLSRAQVFARPMLPRSESVKHITLTPEECGSQHRELLPRGGRTFWFTCKACGSRWPRSREERLR